MIKRTVPLLLLAALVLPTAAAAESSELTGPILVKGRGPMAAEVEMANPAETRALVLGGSGGVVRFVDLAGDLRVECQGKREQRGSGRGERSRGFVVCSGRGGRARVHGSHFRIAARMRTWAMAIPEGASAHVRGRYVTVEAGDEPAREQPRRERPAAADRPEADR
jgi:hypothetical protein